jgi:hypothetical protein
VIDTSEVETGSIDYVATDPTGLTATGTRTAIIKAATPTPALAPDCNATSTRLPAGWAFSNLTAKVHRPTYG